MRKLHLVVLFALVAGFALAMPPASSAQVAIGVSVRIGPPPLRVYEQPMAPGPGYLWMPGYWAYGPDGYYWVPGAWVVPPEPGLLWTPGYWGWEDGYYRWHRGYWGPHVGFYGGINYGFGYFGTGFVGGHWDHDRFYYNRAVWRVNTRVIHDVYIDRNYRRDMRESRVSYNGGRGGIDARPNRDEREWEHERHWDATPMQRRHEEGFRGGDRGRGARPFTPPDRGDMGRGNDRGRRDQNMGRGNEGMGRGNQDMGRGNDRGRGNQDMGRGNDRGDRGNQNMGRGNDRGRGNQDMGRGNDRGNRGNQGMGRGNEGRGNNGRGSQGKPQGKPDHGDRGRGRG